MATQRPRRSIASPAGGGAAADHLHHSPHPHHAHAHQHHTTIHGNNRIVVIGPDNASAALLGSQGVAQHLEQIIAIGRTQQWADAGQVLGCGEINVNERTINCPTSRAAASRGGRGGAVQSGVPTGLGSPDASAARLPNSYDPSSMRIPTSQTLRSAANLHNEDGNNTNNASQNQQQQQQRESQLIHAKCITLNHLLPALSLELFEISENDVLTLAGDQLFGPYVLHSTTAAVTLVVDCSLLFPAPPSAALLIDSVDTAAAAARRQRLQRERERFGGVAGRSGAADHSSGGEQQHEPLGPTSPTQTGFDTSAAYASTAPAGGGAAASGDDAAPAAAGGDQPDREAKDDEPTLTFMLESFKSRQDANAESYIEATAQRITAIRRAIENWAGDAAPHVPLMVALHNTELVASRLEAWTSITTWARVSDAQRQRVLAKVPKNVAQGAGEKEYRLPSLQSCCAAEPFLQPHLSLHRTYPQVSGTIRAVRNIISQLVQRAHAGATFFPWLTSLHDHTPMALLSSVVARPEVFAQAPHLHEIVHTFKSRCMFRRVLVLEPRTGLCVAGDRNFPRYLAGGAERAATHSAAAAAAAMPGVDTSFTSAQSFLHDYLAIAEAMKMTSALAFIANDDMRNEVALVKAAFDHVEQGEILNVAEGGLANFRSSMEMSNGEGVFLYGLAPPVPLVLGCIGDNVEVQRMLSLIEFNLHVVQTTATGIFEEALKRARAAGYAP